jgi:hypothetical protein
MKPIIIISNWKLMGKRTIGITIFPFILLKKSYFENKSNDFLQKTINHEKIHIKQQIELLVIFFYVWYALEWYIKSLKYNTLAYENLSFEREAYNNEEKLDYLKTRKNWSFIKYIIKNNG